jgi:hypothetical protein
VLLALGSALKLLTRRLLPARGRTFPGEFAWLHGRFKYKSRLDQIEGGTQARFQFSKRPSTFIVGSRFDIAHQRQEDVPHPQRIAAPTMAICIERIPCA